jgi:cytochrome c
VSALSIFLMAAGGHAWGAVDEDAAKALAKQSKCTKCHSADKKKDGPAYKETAAKYKGKADAAEKLYIHLTTGPMIKVDGKEEEHPKVKSDNEADIKNLVAYILSQ